jgi:hypothetical protein
MPTLIDGLEDVFLYFGGVPQELLFDQMKAVITRDLRLEAARSSAMLSFSASLGTGASRRARADPTSAHFSQRRHRGNAGVAYSVSCGFGCRGLI